MNRLAHRDFVEATARLTGAGMEARMAEAVVETVNGIAAATAATSEDLERTETRLDHRITEVKGELDVRIESLAGEMRAANAGLRGDVGKEIAGVRTEIAELRTELKGDIAGISKELKGDIAGISKELKGDIAGISKELKGDIASAGNTSFRQMAGIVGFGAALFVLLNMLTPAVHQMLGTAP